MEKRTYTVMVALLNEAVDVWRPVSAKLIGSNRYLIIEKSVPMYEEWEFLPGQVVECQLKEFAEGGPRLTATRQVFNPTDNESEHRPDKHTPPECLLGVMIEDSWVLDWHLEGGTLVIECELSLWEGHPHYEKPKKGEWTCYKRGEIKLSRLLGQSEIVPVESVRNVLDPDGQKDYGSLDSVEIGETEISLLGPFGRATVGQRDFQLTIHGPI